MARSLKKRKRRSTEVNDDPFYIRPDDIPKGQAYQWVVTHVMDEPTPRFETYATEHGWKRVKGYKPKLGCVLMWAPKKVADAQIEALRDAANQQTKEIDELFGRNANNSGVGGPYPMAPESFMVSSDYARVPSGTLPIDVDIKVNFRLDGRFQDAAAALNLSPQEYAQRRLALFISGQIGGILFPINGALELIESAPFHISSKV